MTDKEYKEQKKRVKAIWKKWYEPVGFGWWDTSITWNRERSEDSPSQLAMTSSNWQYRTAHVLFNLPVCADVSDDTLEEAVVHELCHILIAPIQDYRDDQAREITEYTCTSTAKALIWARKAGNNDKH